MNIIKTFGVLSALIASTATVSAQTLMEPLNESCHINIDHARAKYGDRQII